MKVYIAGSALRKNVEKLRKKLDGFKILKTSFGEENSFFLLLEIEEEKIPSLRGVLEFYIKDWETENVSFQSVDENQDLFRMTKKEQNLIDVEMHEARRQGTARCVI